MEMQNDSGIPPPGHHSGKPPSAAACRLCGSPTKQRFSLTVLNKHAVGYWECAGCRSLQTDAPYWLDEAYGSNLADIDTGAAQRNLNSLAASLLVVKLFGVRNAVDFGGGDGLLCRLLRDHGVNCYVEDKYARTTYAAGFTEPDFATPELLLSFEVFEHFVQPDVDLARIFAADAKVVFASTVLYKGQGPDWDYLAADAGQHVFFYSPDAVQRIAARFGYRAFIFGSFLLFLRPALASTAKVALLKFLLRGKALRLVRVAISALPKKGMAEDRERARRAAQRKGAAGGA
jgi:hypothetical protein